MAFHRASSNKENKRKKIIYSVQHFESGETHIDPDMNPLSTKTTDFAYNLGFLSCQ